MKKWIALALALLCAATLGGCGSKKLPEGMDADTLAAAAQSVIALMNDQKFDEIVDGSREDVKTALTAELLSEAYDKYIQPKGAFQEFRNTGVTGAKVKDTGEEYGAAVVIAVYENGKVTFTISFDKDMQMLGLYLQ